MTEAEREAAIKALERALETETDSLERCHLQGALDVLNADQRDAWRRRS